MVGQYSSENTRNEDRWRREERWPEGERGQDHGRDHGQRGDRDRGWGSRGYGRDASFGRSDYGTGREPGGRGDDWRGNDSRSDYGRGAYGRSPGQGWNGRPYSERSYGDAYPDYPSFGGGAWEAGMGMPGTYGGLFGPDYGQASDRYRGYAGSGGDPRNGRDYGRYGRGGPQRGFWDRASDEVASWFGDDDAERRREQDQHRGRGPKGYTRSDDRIREDVSDRLTDDGFVDASNIEVAVANSEVTLTGTVDGRDQRRRAEDCAERVSGVTHVQNNLRVASRSRSGVASSVAYGEAPGDQANTARKTGSSV